MKIGYNKSVSMIEDLRKERLEKLNKLKAAKVDPYPPRTKRTHTIGEGREKFAALAKSKKKVSLAGRVTSIRDQGGVVFLDLKDESGQIQAVLNKKTLLDFELLRSALDRGDFVSVSGPLFKTKAGQESIEAKEVQILVKTIRPVPNERYGVEDIETRLRERYLDLLVNPETKDIFRKKDIFWNSFREYLKKEGFLEVEMPVLEITPGGAEAEPFKTHHNALDSNFYLRISLELPLKKLLVGGFEKVFEIGRIFRNEGMDKEHLQDYTQLEFYWAYHDYNEMMDLVEGMYKHVIKKTTGGLTTVYGSHKIDWGKKWARLDFVEEFKKANTIDPLSASRDELFLKAKSLGLTPEKHLGRGRLIDLIYKKTVRQKIAGPAFLVNLPVEISPLSKRSPTNPGIAERFLIVAGGTELGNGFSELNDPLDQRARFEEQMKLRAAGDKEAQMMDEEFLTALEYGMPPAAGFGISERLFAVLLNKPVRETVIFPLMRKKDLGSSH